MLALGNAARHCHHQREAEVGGGFGEHVGRVADQHAARGAGRHVDVVVANRQAADRAQFGVCGQQCAIDRLRAHHEHAGLALQVLNEFGGRPDHIGLVRRDLEVFAQAIDDVRKHGAADKYGGFHGLLSAGGAGTAGAGAVVLVAGV